MRNESPASIVAAWQDAANRQEVDRLLELSDPNIEIVGPRGSAYGHQILRDWLRRAGLTLTTLRVFEHGDTIVVEQHGIWRSLETREDVDERPLASSFHVNDGRVTRVARYDNLSAAFDDAGFEQSDEK